LVGAIFLAVATSLPEVSTTVEAVRRRRYRLAFSNIFSTNLIDIGILFVADLLLVDAVALEEVGDFSVFAASLGIILTGIYVAGILQGKKRVVFRMGLDSALVFVVYMVGAVRPLRSSVIR
jgi:cation:H+ antiporter